MTVATIVASVSDLISPDAQPPGKTPGQRRAQAERRLKGMREAAERGTVPLNFVEIGNPRNEFLSVMNIISEYQNDSSPLKHVEIGATAFL